MCSLWGHLDIAKELPRQQKSMFFFCFHSTGVECKEEFENYIYSSKIFERFQVYKRILRMNEKDIVLYIVQKNRASLNAVMRSILM